MARTESTMSLEPGDPAPFFALPAPASGDIVKLTDFKGTPALLVAFWCNHCPYVHHVREGFLELARQYHARGVSIVAINSNDAERYPGDAPDLMVEEARRFEYPFPYLYDETQEVAAAYHAACTPDFYVFDQERELVYRGRMDGSRPGNGEPVTGEDLRAALDTVLDEEPAPKRQLPSMGCNIKWKPGNEPSYFG